VKLVVGLGANVGISCLWWLANYRRTQVVAFEPHPGQATRGWISEAGAASALAATGGGGFEVGLLDDPGLPPSTPVRSRHRFPC
jgi:hypothetical protein